MISNTGLATNILKTLETSSSVGMFARDTGGCLISRLGLSRSKDESREISIAELSESALFYFSAPFLAKGNANLFSKMYDVKKDLFTSNIKNLKNIEPNNLKKIKLGKFGQIISTFSIVLPAVFAIAPIRNYVTLSETGKNKFVSVVGLQDKDKKDKQRKKGLKKSKNLLKNLGIIAGTVLCATAGILALSNNKKVYKTLEPIIDKTIKHFDFTKSGDLELLHYGALIYPVSIASYFYASRDKYEVMENARRFSITVPLLFFGEKLIQNPIHKYLNKKFNTNIFDKNGVKPYKELLKLPKNKQKSALKAKNWAYGLTFFINTMAIAGAVALLNRIETKRNYEKEHKYLASNDRYKFIKSNYLAKFPNIDEFMPNIKNN